MSPLRRRQILELRPDDAANPERLSCRVPDRTGRGPAGQRSEPAVFLDRDGVINEEVHLLHRQDQLRLVSGAAAGIRLLNSRGVRVIVATNQSVVARGLCSERELRSIHSALRRLLRRQGAELDAIYYCPHHPEADLPRYRRNCPSRKPGAAMLRDAARRFGVDLARSFLAGDQTVDVRTGIDAGCRTVLLNSGWAGSDGKYPVRADFRCSGLKEAAELICSLLPQNPWNTGT
jgi:histidinol-phosphate phosphatase family protein